MVCKFCHKSLRLEDLRVKDYQARRSFETCGIVSVEKEGEHRRRSGALRWDGREGKGKATVTSQGPVLVGPEAEIKGDVLAPSLAVGAGAILDGNYRIGYPDSPAKLTDFITLTYTVRITQSFFRLISNICLK